MEARPSFRLSFVLVDANQTLTNSATNLELECYDRYLSDWGWTIRVVYIWNR